MNLRSASFPMRVAARVASTALFGLWAALLGCAVHAQADDALPSRVGRVANVQGMLYHTAGEANDAWSPIGLNDPVAQGDNLWTDHDARAEIDYGGGQFRLAGDTNLHVSRLDERQLALFVASGGVIVRVRYLAPDDSVRVDTPQTQVALNRPGLYRIDVDAGARETAVLVREGEADVAAVSGAAQVLPGQMARVADADNGAVDIRNDSALDDFDTWSAARDRVYKAPRNETYVSREMVGQYDLDTYGQWQTYPEYGAVWFPTVDPEWAPYRFGHWTWLPGWGYTWVDDAPWGYAPFHYGRWAYITGRWGWCPGAFVARPAWAPALVAWYGADGPYGGAVAGAPVFGWIPLGWGEPFVPWWSGCTSRCYARFNRPYAAPPVPPSGNRPRQFVNWSVPGGATAVPVATLTSGRPVAVNRVPVAAGRALAPPPLLAGPPAVRPSPLGPGAIRPGNGAPPPVAGRNTATPPALPGNRGGDAGVSRPIPPLRTREPVPALSDRRPAVPAASPERPGLAPLPAPAIRPAPRLPTRAPEPSVRPAPVPPPAPAPAPLRVPAPVMPLPRMPSPPVPGVSPAPPAAVVPPAPVRGVPPAPAPPPARVAPAAPRPPPASPSEVR